jgi:CRP/FNR family transcriptional regulator, anaerobic regulatory protein
MHNTFRIYNTAICPFTNAEWEWLEAQHTPASYKKGDYLIKEGQLCGQVSFVLKGLFISYFENDRHKRIRGFFAENSYVSDYRSFLARQAATTTVQAVEDCEVLQISRQRLDACYAASPVYERWGRLMAEQSYVAMFDRLQAAVLLSPEIRYRQLLLRQPDLAGRVPQYMIASYLGITPEALSRLRKKMRLSVDEDQ